MGLARARAAVLVSPYRDCIQISMASSASPMASSRSLLKPNVIRPAGVSACTPGTGGSVTRSTTTSVVIAHSIAVPLTSPSPWAACPSPRHSSAPGTVTGR